MRKMMKIKSCSSREREGKEKKIKKRNSKKREGK